MQELRTEYIANRESISAKYQHGEAFPSEKMADTQVSSLEGLPGIEGVASWISSLNDAMEEWGSQQNTSSGEIEGPQSLSLPKHTTWGDLPASVYFKNFNFRYDYCNPLLVKSIQSIHILFL